MATASTNVQLNVTGNALPVLQKTQKEVEKLGKSFSGLKNILGGLAIGSMITNMFRAADAISDLSDATNLSVASITALRQAFQLSGGDAEGAEQAILKLYDSIQNAADGNDKLITSFAKVGVSLNDLGTLSEEEISNKVIKGLGEMGNSAEAVSLKMDLMGKSARGVDFTNIANQFDDLKNKAKESEPGIVAAGKIFDYLGKLKSDFGSALAKQFSGLLVTLQKLTANTESLAKSLAELVKIVAILGAAFLIFTKVLPAISSMGDALMTAGAAGSFFGKQMAYIWMNMKNLPKNIAAFVLSLVGMKDALGATIARAGGLASLGAALLNILRIGLRFAGLAGIIIGVAQALNFLIKAITGFDVLDWLGEKLSFVTDKLKEFAKYLGFNFDSKPIEQANDTLEEVNSTAAQTRDRLQQIREENQKFLQSVQDITKAYREQNAETLKQLDIQFKSLHMTEQEIANAKLHDEAVKNLNKTLDELEQKRREALADPSKGAKVVDQIDREIIAVRKSAQETEMAAKIKTDAYYVEQEAIARRNAKLKESMEEIDMSQYLADLQEEVRLSGLYGEELERETKLSRIQSTLQNKVKDISKEILDLERQRKEGMISEATYNTELEVLQKQIEMAHKRAEADTEATDTIIANLKRVESEQVVFDSLNNALKNFIDTGKFKFKDFAASIVKELLYIEAKAAATSLFKSIAGGLTGGIGGIIKGIFGFAEGGTPPVGKASIVGEKGPELFVPRQAGTVVPNDQLGMAAQKAQPVVNNTYVTNNISALDAKSVAQLFAENRKALFGANEMARREMPYGAR